MFLSVLPGLLLAIAIAFVLRRDQPRPPTAQQDQTGFMEAIGQLLAIRNMRVALAVAAMFTAWLVLQNTFLSVYLTQEKLLDPKTAGEVIAMGGVAGIIGGIGLPFLSDRIGRKPVIIGACLAGMGCPIALLLLPGDPILLGTAILLGWLPLGIAPLYCATVPTESVSPALAATAVGLTMGTAEFFGGVVLPPLAGSLADHFGLHSVFLICIALALCAAIVAMFLQETAPRIAASVER